MEYEWDSAKDAENRRRHLLALADGIPALEDPDADSWLDQRFSYSEERIVTLGLANNKILLVVTTERGGTLHALSPSGGPNDMKKTSTIRVTHRPGQKPIATTTDWVAVEALNDQEIHNAAVADRDAQPLPHGDRAGLVRLVNVKKLRELLGLTQQSFAATYRIPIGTLRDWEQRRKYPDAPARAYLMVIARNPKAVAKLLVDAA